MGPVAVVRTGSVGWRGQAQRLEAGAGEEPLRASSRVSSAAPGSASPPSGTSCPDAAASRVCVRELSAVRGKEGP